MFVLEVRNSIIGFLTWTNHNEKYIEIDIFEINPKFRKKGFGQTLYKKAEDYFKTNGFIAIKLFCSPKSSETFWKKMEFLKFPKIGYSESELTYFKPLIKTKEPSVTKFLTNKIELWDIEPYQIKQQVPKWIWEINNDKLPILQPCNRNWNLRVTKNGLVIKDSKVKYFDREKEIDIGPFMYFEFT